MAYLLLAASTDGLITLREAILATETVTVTDRGDGSWAGGDKRLFAGEELPTGTQTLILNAPDGEVEGYLIEFRADGNVALIR